MLHDLHITTVEPRAIAKIPLVIPRDQIQHVMGPGIQELMGAVGAQGIGPAGAWLCHHHRLAPDVWDFDIAVPVTGAVTPTGRVVAGALPGGRVARCVYEGPYEGLGEAWGEFQRWIAAQGLATADGLWEVYASGPETGGDPAHYRTELHQPLRG